MRLEIDTYYANHSGKGTVADTFIPSHLFTKIPLKAVF